MDNQAKSAPSIRVWQEIAGRTLPGTNLWTGFRAFLGRFHRRSKVGLYAGFFVLSLCLAAIGAPIIAPYNPAKQDLRSALQAPSHGHLLGTDELGRDVLSRLIFGARVSLQVGMIAVSIALVLGVTWGLIAGFWGGWVDTVLMRFADALQSFPLLVLAIGITAAFGASLTNAMVATGLVFTPTFVRLTYGQVLSVREREFVLAARAMGAGNARIMLYHLLPNITTPLIVQATLNIAFAILFEAGLSFLGFGAQPPTPAWGSMLRTGYPYLELAPWLAISPGAAIFIAVMAFNFFGDGLRDTLDPSLQRFDAAGKS
ncbi:MAG: ABC transporter permease [Anaerolineae bacterium]